MDKQPFTKPAEHCCLTKDVKMHLDKVKDGVLEALCQKIPFLGTNTLCVFINEVLSSFPVSFRSKSGSEFLWKLDTSSWCSGSWSLSETFLFALGTQRFHWDGRRRKNRQPVHSHLSPTVNNCQVQLECVSPFQEIIIKKKIFQLFSLLSQMQWFTSGVLAKSITVSFVTLSSAAKKRNFSSLYKD